MLRGVRLLLAEDDALQSAAMCAMLKELHVGVAVARDGRQAVQLYERAARMIADDDGGAEDNGSFDIVMLNYALPQLNGIGVSKAIRAAEAAGAPRTPIVGITANPEHKQESLAAGMDAFVTKPIAKHKLASIVARVLRRNQRMAGAAWSGAERATAWVAAGDDGEASDAVSRVVDVEGDATPDDDEMPPDLASIASAKVLDTTAGEQVGSSALTLSWWR